MALTSEWCVMSWWLLQATAMASLFTSNAWYPPNWPSPKPSPFKACRPTAMPSNSDSTFGLAPGCHAGWRGGGLQNSHSHLPAGTSRSPTHLKCVCVAAAEAAASYMMQTKPLMCIQTLFRCWANLSVVQVSEDLAQGKMGALVRHRNPMVSFYCL